ncbi:cupin domain-containing protein [Enterobacteriaceae bacterium H11S18]|uniref:cupin domain-containing protein n=1 Tax=Enterobacteriaceae TaxID=543 RepID=UPI001926917A|nr:MULTISPECIES: cupin domain-containing protein [Enterobacteriaceae]MCT4711109.1 cupin domain-containing protein [Dryocola clanedunensis]
MNNEIYPKETIALNDDEISTELAAINMADIVVPEGAKPLLERRMRCRLLECHPGKIVALHSHKNRPALLYVLQGSGEEHSNQFNEIRIWKEGDCFAEFNDTEHWIKNRSDVIPLRVLTFDLIDDGPTPTKCESGC